MLLIWNLNENKDWSLPFKLFCTRIPFWRTTTIYNLGLLKDFYNYWEITTFQCNADFKKQNSNSIFEHNQTSIPLVLVACSLA